jgi:hypothetical protein
MAEWRENQLPTPTERPEHWVMYFDGLQDLCTRLPSKVRGRVGLKMLRYSSYRLQTLEGDDINNSWNVDQLCRFYA